MSRGASGERERTQPAFRGLIAWQKADELASAVFRSLRHLPAEYAWLRSQATRAAVSVPANIAEGHGRGSLGDYLRFLDIARGSIAELEYYIYFLHKEGLIADSVAADLSERRVEAGRVLFGLWQATKNKTSQEWDHTGRVSDAIGEYKAEVQ